MSRFFWQDIENYFVASLIILSVTATPPNTSIKSEIQTDPVEDRYITEMYDAGVTRKYVCGKMAKLRRVPMCVRLFERPHYKFVLKITFNYESYRNEKPHCETKRLNFRTRSEYDGGVEQEMLLCPGRHDPVRSHWLLDDYDDVFHVSDGPEFDSLIVYQRVRDVHTERYFVYEIIDNFSFQTLGFSIVTVYDTERDLEAAKTIAYNDDAVEVEIIYMLEMATPHDRLSRRGALLSTADPIADLYENELITLCFIIFDRDEYRDIGFRTRQPTLATNKTIVKWEKKILHFEHLPEYNEEGILQKMYTCQPQQSEETRQPRNKNINRKQFKISAGARPSSYFVYIQYRIEFADTYTVNGLVENLTVNKRMQFENASKSASEDQSTPYISLELQQAENVERKYMNEVREASLKKDIVCDTLNTEQRITLCLRVFEQSRFANEIQIHFSYRASFSIALMCQKKLLVFHTEELRHQNVYQRMLVCPGRHDPFRSGWRFDDFKDLIYVSGGSDLSSVAVYRMEKNADNDWFWVQDIININTNLEELPQTEVTLYDVQKEHALSMIRTFNDDAVELEIIFIREIVKKKAPVQDVLINQPKGILTALCYALLDRTPYQILHYEINREAIQAWSIQTELNTIIFRHSVEYNSGNWKQIMYPCYGKHVGSQNWMHDTYMKQFQISAGDRPNSFVIYSLQEVIDNRNSYTIHEFAENVDISKLTPVDIKQEAIYYEGI